MQFKISCFELFIFYKNDIFEQCKGCNNFVFESNLISQFVENVSFLANTLNTYFFNLVHE